jgi:spermidine/putrescine transport system substrate-binding protein
MAAAGVMTVMHPIAGHAQETNDDQAIYFTWSGYDLPEFYPGYVEKYGMSPQTPLFGDNAETFAKMRAGFQVDVTHPCAGSQITRFRDAGLLQTIDTSRLSNWPDLIPALTDLEGSVTDEGTWFVPVDWGQTSITYRTDIVDWKGEPESWSLLWDPEYAGRLSVIDAAEDAWWCAAVYAGVDVNNLTEPDLEKVKVLLEEQRPLLRFYSSDMTTVDQAMATGELVAAMTWNSSPWTLADQGVPVKFADPKEGALTWVCGLVIASGAPHEDKAYDLIDAIISPAAGEFLIGDYGYGHSNAKAFEAFSEEELAARGLSKNAMSILNKGVFVLTVDPMISQKIEEDWSEVTAGF